MKHTRVCMHVFAAAAMVFGILAAGASAVTVVDFEDFTFSGGYYNGSDSAGGYLSGNIFFPNYYNTYYGSWENWGASNLTETTPPNPDDYFNSIFPIREFSAMAGGGHASSANYAVSFPSFTTNDSNIVFQQPLELSHTYFTNTNYAYHTMLNGDPFGYAKKFGGTTGDDPDYFYITITGKNATGATTGSVDFYLADYRDSNNANDYIISDWTEVDLSGLGSNVKSLEFTWASSDAGIYGINTPTYFTMDDLTISEDLYASTWNGGGTTNHWSNADNFGGEAHVSGESVLFDGSTQLTAENDFADGRQFGAIVFGSQAGAFTLVGNPLRLQYDLANFSAETQTIDLPIVLSGGDQSIFTAIGDILIEKPIREDGSSLGITKTGKHTLILDDENTYTGSTNIVEGALALAVGGEISVDSAIHVAEGALFSIVDGTHTVGAIDGAGTTEVAAGAQLTATSIIQGTLSIGAGGRVIMTPLGGGGVGARPVPEPGVPTLIIWAVVLGMIAFRARKR